MKSFFKMSFQANNCSRMGESSDNEIKSNFNLPILINDPNGNEVPCSTEISPETVSVTIPLTNGNSDCPDMKMLPFNVGVNVRETSDPAACRLCEISGPDLEMAQDCFCDHEASVDMVVTDSLSSSSDYQCMTANLSWSSKCSATPDPGQHMLDHKQCHVVKSQLPCIKALSEYHTTDIEGKLNTYVTNEARLQKSLEHHVMGDGFKLSITDSPKDTLMRITMSMERGLEYSRQPCESKLEMKHISAGSLEDESSAPVLESSVSSHDSDYPFLMSDQSLETFESQGESGILNATQIMYQLPLKTNFHSQGCAVGVSNQQHVLDKAEVLYQTHSNVQSTGSAQYPAFNANKNFREEIGHNVTGNTDFYRCVKYQSQETVDGQLPVINEQCDEEIRNKMGKANYEMPTNSAMNTTFIVLKEVNNDPKLETEINSCRTEAQDLVPKARASIQGSVNNTTFLVSNQTIHEHENLYSQTSTPLAGSKRTVFFSSPLQNLTSLSDHDSCSAEESPSMMLLSDARGSVQKPGFKMKCNANMKPKLSKVEIKSYPKPNFNNVKPKVVSRTQQMSSVPKGNVCLSREVSCKYFPRSTSSFSSLDSPCSRSPVPKHKKEPLSKSALKTKSEIMRFQKLVFRKRLSANEPQTGMTESKTSKSSYSNSPQARAPSNLAFANGAGSQVSGSLHFSKPLLSSMGTSTCELKMFHADGIENINPSRKIIPVVEKPRVRCSNLADAIDDHPVSFIPVSAAALENLHTMKAPLTKSSAPSIGEVQVEQRPRGNTKSQTVLSPSAKLRAPSSLSRLRLGRVSNDGHTGNMHGSTNKQPLTSDQQKAVVASTNRRGDGPRKGVLSASPCGIQTSCTKSLQKNKVLSVKTPCRGVNRNVTTSSQNVPGSASRSTRQLSASQNLKADRTCVKSNSFIHKPSSQTTRTSTRAPADLLPVVKKSPGLLHYKAKCEKQIEWIALLKELLKTSNQRFEAVAIVVQYLQAQRDEVGKQHKELSQELLTLRSELESRNVTCVHLEKDREELQNKYEGVIQKLSEEHQAELKGLEKRLEELFTAEKEHLQQNFKNDVKKLQAQLQNEIEGLTSEHEAHKLELFATHSKNLECLQKEYQQSLTELSTSHEREQKILEESFKERLSLLQGQITELNEENDSLKEEIKTKEEVAKAQGQKDQKIDPLSLYLKQELESLKAVLEIKNEKIHNQEKKLMQMEKLMEKHTVLDEKLKIVLQENEDLKARMDKHIAVSRQLSTEQVVLQESLQKESKVNKRLSMENEELLWKLQNGDVLGPKKLSPTSPLSFQPSKTSVSPNSNPAPSPR
ncbi:microtubule-associated tumor suppressor 1 homolog isoform X2 [Carcharodon carcharias]|uniref:microtubule-associated tumor suppressor 1 homolog isoform X2 n=1 Tax=Carcharodon carcharias TaxID=13397 RepID=UPI001B7E365C|nr:microtubule-associated tumor suppressor 1 homolog isoform X2 [Carcharodon carcharias]